MRFFTLILFLCLSNFLLAQQPIVIQKQLKWSPEPILHNPTGNIEKEIWTFEESYSNAKHPTLPVFSERFEVPANGILRVSVINAQYEPVAKKETVDDIFLKETLQIQTTIEKDKNQHYGKVFFIPIIKNLLPNFEIFLNILYCI